MGEAYVYNSLVKRIIDALLDGEWKSIEDMGLYSTAYMWAAAMVKKGYLEERYIGRKKYYRIRPDLLDDVREMVRQYNSLLRAVP